MFRNALLAACAATVACAMPASATILTFDSDVTRPYVIVLDQSYGDNVDAALIGTASYGVGVEGYTPDVTVGYSAVRADNGAAIDPSNMTRWDNDFGDLTNVFENEYDDNTLTYITFNSAAGHSVDLYGFDMGGWPNSDRTIANIAVLSGANVLFSQDNVLIQGAIDGGPRHTSFAFASPLSGSDLTIRLTTGLGGDNDTVGFDNIRFGQDAPVASPAPEPASWAMMVGGFGLIGSALRRRRQATARFA